MIEFKLTTKNNEEVVNKIKQAPEQIEKDLNVFLHGKGGDMVAKRIIGFTPRSGRKKSHAKDHDYISKKGANLGIEFSAKKQWGYIVFPNDGIGRHNPRAQRFFERGLEAEQNNLFNEILRIIEKNLNK